MPLMLAEANPALRRVHERAAAAAPPSPPGRLHIPQGAARVLPPRQEALRGDQQAGYRMIQSFYNAAAGRRIHSAAIVAYASAGEFARWNPHLHAIFLEGGFDRAERSGRRRLPPTGSPPRRCPCGRMPRQRGEHSDAAVGGKRQASDERKKDLHL